MNPLFCRSVMIVGMLLAAPGFAAVEEPATKPTETPTAEASDAAFLKKLDTRVSTIVTLLDVDQEKGTRLHGVIVGQYRAVNEWHAAHDARLKDLGSQAAGADAEKSAAAKREIADAKAALKSLHHHFISALGADLNPAQIEKVKDGMTAGKVQFTYGGYLQKYPELTDTQKAKVLAFLQDAREEAMDAGSMDEKSAIFNQYKGKINNYLVSQGVGKRKKEKSSKTESTETPSK